MPGDEGVGESSETGSDPSGTSAPAAAVRSVFLSYASHDAGTANSVCQYLECQGESCWLAPRDVKPGAEYADAIVGAINEAKAVVLLLSGSAVASSHVGREVERAASKHKPIIAFRIDTAPLSRALEYFLSNSQWIDVPALGMQGALVKLAEAVGQGSAPTGVADADFPGKRKRRRLAVVAAVGLGVGIASLSGVYLLAHKAPRFGTTVAVADKSIAVLPFVDLSEKKDQEYFADGIAEEVLDRLAKVPGLKVVGRVSLFQFKGKSADPASIGIALGVAYLLEGSVRKEAGRVRVAAQLVETRTGAQRWSDDFDSDVIDVLRVQDTIAAEIARALQIAVEADTVLRASVKSPEALDAYLRGLHSRGTREGTEAAVADFEKALALDPTAASYICRARVGGRYCRPVNCLPGRCPERIDSPCTLANRQMPTHFSIMSRGD